VSNVSDESQEPKLALRFIAGNYKGIDYPLLPRREIRVGRARSLELVLADELVSRRHACLSTAGDELTLIDLGSTNGTVVNGTRVTRARLEKGDRVLIGHSVIEVIGAEDSRSMPLSMAGARFSEGASHQEEPTARFKELATSPDVFQSSFHFQGSLEEVPLVELLQVLAHLKRTGVLCISAEREARVHLREGTIRYVSIEGLRLPAVKAAFRVFGWRRGTFHFQPGPPRNFEGEIGTGNDALIMEAIRQMDEMERLSPRLPALEDRLALSSPLAPRLRDLSGDELDILQAVSNSGRLAQVLDGCSANDADVCARLTSLIGRGYVRVERVDANPADPLPGRSNRTAKPPGTEPSSSHAEVSGEGAVIPATALRGARDVTLPGGGGRTHVVPPHGPATKQASAAPSSKSLERTVVNAWAWLSLALTVALVCTGVYLATHGQPPTTPVANHSPVMESARPAAEDINQRLAFAESLLEQGRINDAYETVNQVLRIAPDNAEALALREKIMNAPAHWQSAPTPESAVRPPPERLPVRPKDEKSPAVLAADKVVEAATAIAQGDTARAQILIEEGQRLDASNPQWQAGNDKLIKTISW